MKHTLSYHVKYTTQPRIVFTLPLSKQQQTKLTKINLPAKEIYIYILQAKPFLEPT